MAGTQLAIGTSVLWIWVAIFSLFSLYPTKRNHHEPKEGGRTRLWSMKNVAGSFRAISRTLGGLVEYGQALGLVCVILVSATVFCTIGMRMTMNDTGETLGFGTYREYRVRPALPGGLYVLTITSTLAHSLLFAFDRDGESRIITGTGRDRGEGV
jgi:hypothetical protein